MSSDKRRHERKTLKVEFQAEEGEGAGQLLFEGVDLSTGGTFLLTDLLLERDDRLTLVFKVPDQPHTFKALARVAWVRRFPKEGESAGMGIEFLSMSPDERTTLEAFLKPSNG